MKKFKLESKINMRSPVFLLISAETLSKLKRRRTWLRKKEGLPPQEWAPDLPNAKPVSLNIKPPTEEEIEKEMRKAPSHPRRVG